MFNRPAGGWARADDAEPDDQRGRSGRLRPARLAVALSPDGTYLAAGAPGYSSSGPLTGQGGVYVWSYGGGALTTVGTEPLTASDAGNEDDTRLVGGDAERQPDLRGGAVSPGQRRTRGRVRLLVARAASRSATRPGRTSRRPS